MKQLKKYLPIATFIAIIAIAYFVFPAHADNCITAGGTSGNAQLCNPLGTTDPRDFIGKIIKSLIGISGTAALVIFIYGGIIWMTSEGSQDKVKKGLDTMIWAAIGLAVIFASYTLVNYILTAILGSTTN